jgi:hypothetical protein
MLSRLRIILLFALCALSFGLVACGGTDDEAASQDVDSLLEETFSNDQQVESGNLDVKVKIEAQGSSQLQGPVTVSLKGPFQSEGDKKLPQFSFDASFEGAGQTFAAGITSTGDKGFVNFQGTDYAVSDEIFAQFKQGFEEAQAQGGGKDDDPSLATLGIDPRKWLTNPKNEGEAKVGDDDAVKITGGVDVPKLLDDVNVALDKARSLNLQGAGDLPTKLTAEQRKQIEDALQDVKVEIYTGTEDKILRRMLIALKIQAPEGTADLDTADISFDISITGVNEDQTIEAPENTKPLDELLGQLGGLGLGGLGGASGSGSGGSASGGTSADALETYSDCVRDAGSDAAKAQQCADLLTP